MLSDTQGAEQRARGFRMQPDDGRMQLPPAARHSRGDPDVGAMPKRFSVNPKKWVHRSFFIIIIYIFFFLPPLTPSSAAAWFRGRWRWKREPGRRAGAVGSCRGASLAHLRPASGCGKQLPRPPRSSFTPPSPHSLIQGSFSRIQLKLRASLLR